MGACSAKLSRGLPTRVKATIAFLRRLGKRLAAHEALAISAQVAFELFLSLIPLLVAMGYIIGSLVRKRGVDTVLLPLLETAPAATRDIVKEELQRMASANASPAPLAVLGFLYAASASVHVLMTSVEKLEHRRRRPWWKKRLVALGWIGALLTVVTANAWLLVEWQDVMAAGDPPRPALQHVAPAATGTAHPTHASTSAGGAVAGAAPNATPGVPNASRGNRPPRTLWRASKVRRYVTLGSSFLLALGALTVFFRHASRRPKATHYRPWPGAICTVLVWIVASWLFGLYAGSIDKYTLYYGSLATVAVMLVWLWISAFAILLGAELNAELARLDADVPCDDA